MASYTRTYDFGSAGNRASLTLFYAQFRFCADVFRTREIKSTTRCELKGEDCAAKGVMFAEISESAQKRFHIGISTYFSFAQLTGLYSIPFDG